MYVSLYMCPYFSLIDGSHTGVVGSMAAPQREGGAFLCGVCLWGSKQSVELTGDSKLSKGVRPPVQGDPASCPMVAWMDGLTDQSESSMITL